MINCMKTKIPFRTWTSGLAGAFLAAAMTLSVSAQENWPQFRGADSRGVGAGPQVLPEVWDTKKNVVWKTEIPGMGWSSPVVWGNRVFLTTVQSEGEVEPPKKGLYFGGDRPEPSKHAHHWLVLAVDFQSGRILWRKEIHQGLPASPLHVKNTYASETPVTDGERLYAYFGYLGLFCLNLDGELLWKKTWPARKMRNGWGTSASPVLHGDRVIIVNDNEEESFVAAFDKRTGEEIWRQKRDEPSNFSTPFIWETDLRTEIITTGRTQTRSYSLDGQLLWHCQGMSTIVIPTPFAWDGKLFVAAGYVGDSLKPNKPVYAIKPGAAGNVSLEPGQRANEHIVWMEENAAPYNPSPLVYDGRFYVLWDFGFLSARDARTGREIYDKERLNPQGRAGFTSSPWAYQGKVFCLSEDGDTYVVRAGDKFDLLHINRLDEMCMATPAMARGSLFIRTASQLYRIASRAELSHR